MRRTYLIFALAVLVTTMITLSAGESFYQPAIAQFTSGPEPPPVPPAEKKGKKGSLEITQETEQEAESGDVNQSFTVTQEGDNSNQCVGIQGVANTGNAQNVSDVTEANSEADDFELEEVGADLTVTGTGTTTCDQQVNQAAAAGR